MSKPDTISGFKVDESTNCLKQIAGLRLANNFSSFLSFKRALSGFLEKSKLLSARRKRLWEDHEKDETGKINDLVSEFKKNFRITKDEIYQEIDICMGTILDLYYQIEEKYNKIYIKSRRGRPAKQ